MSEKRKYVLAQAPSNLIFADSLISWGVNGNLVNILIGTPDHAANTLDPENFKIAVTADLRLPIALVLEIAAKVGPMIENASNPPESGPPPQNTILN